MAKLVHLKKQDGKSFYVTPHAFETTIKTEKNWRKKYDYVGEVDEEEVGSQSESAQKTNSDVKTDAKSKVSNNEREESNEEIFSSKNNGGVSDIEKFEEHMEKTADLIHSDKLEEARVEVKKALTISPNSKAAGRALEHINESIQSKLNTNNSEHGNEEQQSGKKSEDINTESGIKDNGNEEQQSGKGKSDSKNNGRKK